MARKEEQFRVKLTSARAGHSQDDQGRVTGVFAQSAGDVVEMDKSEAERHIQNGLAVAAPEESKGK